MLFVDFACAPPVTLRTLVLTRLRRLGLRGGIVSAMWRSAYRSTSKCLNVAPGLSTNAIVRKIGFGEGRVLSPVLFVFVIDELLCELRDSGLGARAEAPGSGPSVWAGAAMLTDDLALMVKDDAEPRAMFEIVLHRGWRHRFVIAYKKRASSASGRGGSASSPAARTGSTSTGRLATRTQRRTCTADPSASAALSTLVTSGTRRCPTLRTSSGSSVWSI